LSQAEARCHVRGEAVRVACWVAAEADALVVEVTDEREPPQPIDVRLAMWREPEGRTGPHVAAYAWRQTEERVAVVQTFREAKHFCGSAVAVSSPGSGPQILDTDAKSRVLRLPPARGTRAVVIASCFSTTWPAPPGARSRPSGTARSS
jgi:hypothetical protein